MNTEKSNALLAISIEGKKTAAEMRDAIAAMPISAKLCPDFINQLCYAKGIDPQAEELQEFYRQTVEHKATIEKENEREALGHAISDMEAITKEYRENEKRGATPSKKQIDEITERINKQTAKLGAAQGKRRIYTMADYTDDCLNYDPSKDFTPTLFGRLAFPDGTTSYIGARTSRGKTTVLVNLAREALIQQSRKTIFITLEMSGKQILNKMILSTAFSNGIKEAPENRRAFMTMKPCNDIYKVWKNGELSGIGATVFRNYVKNAHSIITKAETSEAFILYDSRGASEQEIINFIHAHAEPGTVILLDYIQKIPPKSEANADSFRKIQAISYDVVNAAAKTNSVIIAGAQFNRMGKMDAFGDCFDDQSFGEAGDIEQDAHNAIGIGWKTDKQDRFYEVLKTREDKKQGTLYDIDFVGSYSYMEHGEQIYRPIGEKKQFKDNSKETEKTRHINNGPL